MIVKYYNHYEPLVMYTRVVDDFGSLLVLNDDFPDALDTFNAAFDFAESCGAIQVVSEGERH